MPRLMTQRRGRRRKVPPCGRLIEYRPPHSPFQKLIDSARLRRRMSSRELAVRIDVSPSTLWIWLHSMNGFPHPKAFKAVHIERLSRTLKIPPPAIAQALDASRHLFTGREKAMPHEMIDAFRHFIEILRHDRRQTISKKYVLNLAEKLYDGVRRPATPRPEHS